VQGEVGEKGAERLLHGVDGNPEVKEWPAQTSRAPFPVATVAGIWAGKVLMDFLLVSLANRRLSRGQKYDITAAL